MIFVLNVFYSFFYTDFSVEFAYILGGFIAALLIINSVLKNRISKELILGLRLFVIPFAAVNLFSCITAELYWHTSYTPDITQSILRIFHITAAYLIAYASIVLFGTESIKLILIAGIISYVTVIIQFYLVEGGSLESHGFIELSGILFLYFVLSDNYRKRDRVIALLILGVILFLGDKRVVWVALGITLFIYYLFHKFNSKQMLMLKVILMVYTVMTFVYLWLIKSGTMQLIFMNIGIADNSRIKFWNFFSDSYNLSPFYLGRGVQYTDNRMTFTSTMSALGITNRVGIHNDILRSYIGWGFIPFIVYYFNFFVLNLKKIEIFNPQCNIWKYFALVSYCFFTYMVDYMLTDIPFNICLFMACLLLIRENTK